MTNEEKMKMYHDMREGSRMMVEKLSQYFQTKREVSMHEMAMVADIVKDISEVEKNLAKACYYSRDMSETML